VAAFLLSILFVLTIAATSSARGWRGIVPLHSTRADVERLLGKSTDECNCIYRTDNEWVRVYYAKAPCEGWLSGWNVPENTVLELNVGVNLKFSDLRIDESNFSKTYDDATYTYYANRKEGVQYIVSYEGDVRDIKYFPSSDDVNLRCKCFPLDDGSVFRGISWDSFEGISMDNMFVRLDNYVIQLQNLDADWNGHVITYSPLRAGRSKASAFRKRIYDWLTVKRGFDQRGITVIDGGHRERFAAELYLLPPGVSVPSPLPTIGSCDTKRVYRR
jgi:hypothetical protein